jgi:two-component system response regulator YesN
VVVRGYRDLKDLERWMQQQILQRSPKKMAAGWIEVDDLNALGEGFSLLYPYLDWNISMDNKVLICYPQIKNVQTASCNYPIDLEMQMRTAICSDDQAREQEVMKEFHDSFCDGKIYAPKEIKESYVRFLWNIIAIAKEVGKVQVSQINQQELLSRIMNAKLREELTEASSLVLEKLTSTQDTDTTHLTVKRMKSMIHEFYQTGIMLDEISRKLDMTPEYLGTLFHRETGTTFSNYVKNYRISKAKELLVGTNLKLYEVAEKVGYSDPKYFSRVFKEITGQLPVEYRRNVK